MVGAWVGGVVVGGAGVGQMSFWKAVQVSSVAEQTRDPQHAYGADPMHAEHTLDSKSAGNVWQAYARVLLVPALYLSASQSE